MYAKISSIGQMSDSILSLIFPKNFYYFSPVIPNIVVGITYLEKETNIFAILLREHLHAVPNKKS